MNRSQFSSRRTQRGITLVELMVGTVLSLLVVLAATSLLLMQKRGYSTQDDHARMQENARVAASQLTRTLKLAGYRGIESPVFTASVIGGLNAYNSYGASDYINVSFYGASTADGTGADGSIVDCLGNAIGATSLATFYYWIFINPADGQPALYCTSTVATPGAPAISGTALVVPRVETMQILIGDDPLGTGTVGRYQPFSTASPPVNPRAVWIALVLSSPTAGHPTGAATYNLFGTDYAPGGVAPSGDAGAIFAAPNDGHMRKVVLINVALRNFLD